MHRRDYIHSPSDLDQRTEYTDMQELTRIDKRYLAIAERYGFGRPTFWSSTARFLDVFGKYYRIPRTRDYVEDMQYAYWTTVGDYLRRAMQEKSKEMKRE